MHEELWLTDPRIGIKMDSSEDQGQRLQDAVDLAATARGEGVLRLNPGTVQVNREIVAPKETQLPALIGVAAASGAISGRGSVLQWTKDLGEGRFAIKPRQGPGGWLLQDFEAAGPGQVRKIGQDACKMDGLLFPGKGYAHGVLSHQFRANGVVLDDHQQWHSCDFGAGSYGLLWASEENDGLGDHLIVRTHLESCSKAAIGVRSSSAILQARFIQCHIGLSPFSIYRFASGTTDKTVFLFGVFFDNCSFEDAGSAIIFDEVGGSAVQNLVFDSPPFTALNSGYALEGQEAAGDARLRVDRRPGPALAQRRRRAAWRPAAPALRRATRRCAWTIGATSCATRDNRVFAPGAARSRASSSASAERAATSAARLIAGERPPAATSSSPMAATGAGRRGASRRRAAWRRDVPAWRCRRHGPAGSGVRPRVARDRSRADRFSRPTRATRARSGGPSRRRAVMGRALNTLTRSNGDATLFGMAA